MVFKRTIFVLITIAVFFNSKIFGSTPCSCPAIPFDSLVPTNYEIIFCGKVIRVLPLNENLKKVIFSVEELYKGMVTREWEVLYNPEDPCAVQFQVNDEWILFLNYYQKNNSKMDWCSPCRKYYKNKMDDPFRLISGWEYDDVKFFLKRKLGIKQVTEMPVQAAKGRNIIPDRMQMLLIIAISFIIFLGIYFMIRKK